MEQNAADKLLEVATALFAEKGYASVSLNDIAAAAGVDAAEVVRLLGSKKKIYGAVLERQFGIYATRMQAALAGDLLPVKKIELMARTLRDMHRQTPHFFTLFYRELLDPSPFFETIVKGNIRRVAYLSDNNIAKGIQKGAFKYEINPANATMLLLGMFHYNILAGRLIETLLPEQGSGDDYPEQALKVFLSGIKKNG